MSLRAKSNLTGGWLPPLTFTFGRKGMETQTNKLIAIVGELILLLRSDNETHWSAWMSKVKLRLEESDYSGVEYLLDAYGGMGSFNDLVICQRIENGNFIMTEESKAKNDKLDFLRSSAWELAIWLKRNHEINNSEPPLSPSL